MTVDMLHLHKLTSFKWSEKRNQSTHSASQAYKNLRK